MRAAHVVSALLLAATMVASPATAQKKGRPVDRFWSVPGLDSLALGSIALLPVATFDGSLEARRIAEQSFGQSLRSSGHRWVSPSLAREYLARTGGDSLVQAVQAMVVRGGRIDSLAAASISRSVRARGLMTVRIDQWEQRKLEFNQSGNPSTTIQVRAALVDSTGLLLWTASGSETADGPYQDASTAAVGVKASGLNNTPLTNQGGAPTYQETLAKILARWVPEFPRRAAPATPTTPAN